MGVDRRVCLCAWVGGWVGHCGHACVYACICVCVSEGAVFGLQAPQRGPMCCYQPLGLWDWQWSPETKQFVHFLESQWTSVSVRVHDQWVEREREGKRGLRYVHNCTVWIGQILQHIYISRTGHTSVFTEFKSIKEDIFMFFLYLLLKFSTWKASVPG